MLILILKEKLLGVLELLVSKKFNEVISTLKYLHEELLVKETYSLNKKQSPINEYENRLNYLTSHFHAGTCKSFSKNAFAFCSEDIHTSSQCKKMTNIDSRKEI